MIKTKTLYDLLLSKLMILIMSILVTSSRQNWPSLGWMGKWLIMFEAIIKLDNTIIIIGNKAKYILFTLLLSANFAVGESKSGYEQFCIKANDDGLNTRDNHEQWNDYNIMKHNMTTVYNLSDNFSSEDKIERVRRPTTVTLLWSVYSC